MSGLLIFVFNGNYLRKVKLNKLVIDYMPLAKKTASRYYTLNYDDRNQEAFLGLIMASDTFDESKGNFAAYAIRIITNRLNRLYNEEKCKLFELFDYGDDFVEGDNQMRQVLNKASNDNVEQTAFNKVIINSLDDISKKVFGLLVSGKTQTECANILNMSQPTIHRSIKLLKGALTEA